MRPLLTAVALVASGSLGAGCASALPEQPLAAKAPRYFHTGSNIPVSDPPEQMSEEEKQRAMDRLRYASEPRGPTPGGGATK